MEKPSSIAPEARKSRLATRVATKTLSGMVKMCFLRLSLKKDVCRRVRDVLTSGFCGFDVLFDGRRPGPFLFRSSSFVFPKLKTYKKTEPRPKLGGIES